MPDSSGEGLNVIYDTTQAGYSPVATGNTNLVSFPFDIRYAKSMSVHILTDGGASVDYGFQVTNVPPMISFYGRTIFGNPTRDDSYTSGMWVTVNTGTVPTGAAIQSQMLVLGQAVQKHGRCLFAWNSGNAGGATAKLIALLGVLGG